MSVLVAIKNSHGVIIGADKQAIHRWKNKVDGVQKIYYNKIDNTVMGCVGYLRDCNLISLQEQWINYKDIVEKTEIDLKYVIENVVPTLFQHFSKYSRVEKNNSVLLLLSSFAFCTKDRMFVIDSDGGVVECEDYIAIGCGEELVSGYLNTIPNLQQQSDTQIKEIIEKAIKIACKNDVWIGNEIDLIELKSIST